MNRNIKRVACVGSGLIGQGWATLFAAAGYDITIQDLSNDKLEHAAGQVKSNLIHLEENDRLHQETATGAYKRIRTTLNLV